MMLTLTMRSVPDTVDAQQAPAAGDTLTLDEMIAQATDSVLSDGNAFRYLRTLSEGMIDRFVEHLPQVAAALFLGLLLFGVYQVVYGGVRRMLRQSRFVKLGTERLALQSVRLVAVIGIGLVVLGQLGFNIGAILAGVGMR